MPRLSRVSSSGVRASSTMLPMPTEVRAPSASSSCCSRAKVMTSAARGTSTTSTDSGACGARGRTIPTYSKAAQVKMTAAKRKNQIPESSTMPATMIGVPTAAVSRRCVEDAGALRGGWVTCSMAAPTQVTTTAAEEAAGRRGRIPRRLARRQDFEDHAGGILVAHGEAAGVGCGPAALERIVVLEVAAEQDPADVSGGEVVEPGLRRGIDPWVAAGIAGGVAVGGAVDVDIDRLPLEERAHGRVDEIGGRGADDVDGAVAAVRVEPTPGAREQVG